MDGMHEIEAGRQRTKGGAANLVTSEGNGCVMGRGWTRGKMSRCKMQDAKDGMRDDTYVYRSGMDG